MKIIYSRMAKWHPVWGAEEKIIRRVLVPSLAEGTNTRPYAAAQLINKMRTARFYAERDKRNPR